MEMKFIQKIAKECGVDNRAIRHIIKKENIQVSNFGKQSVTVQQEEIIHRILFFEGMTKYITLESKMNVYT